MRKTIENIGKYLEKGNGNHQKEHLKHKGNTRKKEWGLLEKTFKT